MIRKRLKKEKDFINMSRSNTILLAVGDFIVYKFLKWHLNYFGYRIDRSVNEKKLIKKLKKANIKNIGKSKKVYELIIIDLKLFNMQTLEVIKNFHKIIDVPFIFLTSNSFPQKEIENIISAGIKSFFCNINDFDEILVNINKIIPLEDNAIEIKKPSFPLKISFQNYTGIKGIIKSFIIDKASILNTFSKKIKEGHLIIIDLHFHEKLSEYYKIEIQIKLHNGNVINKSYFFNKNKTNIYKEIKDLFAETAIRMKSNN